MSFDGPLLSMLSLCALLTSGASLAATGASPDTAVSETASYPAPRFPAWLVSASDEELLAAARSAVRQTSGRSPLGNIAPGETVHVFLTADQDPKVWDAIQRAWGERGVKAVAVPGWEWSGMTREDYEARAARNKMDGSSGWKEFGVFEQAYVRFLPQAVQKEFADPMTTTAMMGGLDMRTTDKMAGLEHPKIGTNKLELFLDSRPDIQRFFAFAGGGPFVRRAIGARHASKFRGNWIYFTRFDLQSHASAFPSDLWRLIDEEIVRPISYIAEGTFRDPQGTRLHWLLTPEQSQIWEIESGLHSYAPGHLNIYPAGTHATWTEGVLAATGNHAAYYPQMIVHITEHGRVASVQGGGKAGDLFRALLENPLLKDAKFPSSSENGYWFLAQDGLGTNPKLVRNMDFLINGSIEMPNLSERDRAGIQHFSFASPVGPNPDPDPTTSKQDLAYAQSLNLPISHTAHMHVYFGTAKWKLRDTGEWMTVLDRGRLAAFDNPEVRALASRYGDPDVIFSYDWIPSLPGVNVPGNYDKDFAPDPWSWIKAEWSRILNGSYKYYVKNYDMFVHKSP